MRKLTPSASISKSNRLFAFEKCLIPPQKTLADIRDDLKLRRLLQRSVLRERAPQRLIDSIKNGIRA